MLLTGGTDKIQMILGAAVTVDVHTDYFDVLAAAVTPGRKNTAGVAATTYDIVDSPSGGALRNVHKMRVRNKHATSSVTVTLQHTDGTTIVELYKVTLLAGEMIIYDEDGEFILYGSDGVRKSSSASPVTKALLADVSNSTTTAAKITGLDQPVLPGVYIFEYYVVYQSSVVTTGVKLGCNFSGTVTQFLYDLEIPSADTTATATQTAIADQDIKTATMGLLEVLADRAKSTSAPLITAGVDTINVDNLAYIRGIMVVTATGNIELYHASETANATTIKANSALRLTKVG